MAAMSMVTMAGAGIKYIITTATRIIAIITLTSGIILMLTIIIQTQCIAMVPATGLALSGENDE